MSLERLRTHFIDSILPHWLSLALDEHAGQFMEALKLDGTRDKTGIVRVRSAARQIYVDAHAAALGVAPEHALTNAERAFENLRRTARIDGGKPGYASSFHLRTGELKNPRRDLYDHAYVLLALAWLSKATCNDHYGGLIAQTVGQRTHHSKRMIPRNPFLKSNETEQFIPAINTTAHQFTPYKSTQVVNHKPIRVTRILQQPARGGNAQTCALFIKTVKTTSKDAAYNQTTFYEAWKLAIQRYGIFNPYTGRGVIKGLLPHGPHNVRDVLATHILKQTGSYEQASCAIQDTPDMVTQHYGRFLPQDKAALATKILNRVWEAA